MLNDLEKSLEENIERRAKAFIGGIVDFALPVLEKDIGREVRGIELASFILERSLGEGLNTSLFGLLANTVTDISVSDGILDFSFEFFNFVEDKFGKGKFSPPLSAPLNLAKGYVYGLLPYEYR